MKNDKITLYYSIRLGFIFHSSKNFEKDTIQIIDSSLISCKLIDKFYFKFVEKTRMTLNFYLEEFELFYFNHITNE